MTPTRPYLLRAIYEWLLDNHLTPYLLVDTRQKNVEVPTEFIQENGTITLNISPTAVQGLALENNYLGFTARFSGQVRQIYVPMPAILGLYARENGQGMMFQEENIEESDYLDIGQDTTEKTTENDKPEKKKRPSFLKVVK